MKKGTHAEHYTMNLESWANDEYFHLFLGMSDDKNREINSLGRFDGRKFVQYKTQDTERKK